MKGRKRVNSMPEIFGLIMDIGEKAGALPVKDKVWTHKVNENWSFKVNGYPEPREGIPGFHVMVEFNGFPAGLIGLNGGIIAAGEAANEDTFIEALKQHLAE